MKKPKIPLIRETYPKVRILSKTNPQTGTVTKSFQVDCENERWKGQKTFSYPTRDEALTKAREVEKLVSEQGFAGINHEDVRMLERVKTKLLPLNVSLEFAVDNFVESYSKTIAKKNTETMVNVTAWYLESKKSGLKPLRDDTLRGIKATCAKLRDCFGDVAIGEITSDKVEKALFEMNTKNTTKLDYLKRFRSFFKWAKSKQYIDTNPCGNPKDGDDIKVYGKDKDETLILNNDDVVTLLGNLLDEPELIPYVSLCLFAGVRPTECVKLKWQDIWNDERKMVYLSKNVTKTYERNTPIFDCLSEWLKLGEGKPIAIKNQRKTLDKVKEGVTWQKDILRHTAISHFMGKEKNIYEVSEHLGNSPDIIKKHYQRRVLKTDTDFFWSLTPSKVQELIKARNKKAIDATV